MRNKRFLAVGGLALSTSLMLAACSTPAAAPEVKDTKPDSSVSEAWSNTLAAADKEGVLSVYSVLVPAVNDQIKKNFEAAHPKISLQIVRVLGNEIDARLAAEKSSGAPTADLVINVNYDAMLRYDAKGELAKATGPNATNDAWKNSGGLINGTIQMTAITGMVIACNTQIVKDCPKSYNDVANKKYAGLVGIPNNTSMALTSFWDWTDKKYPGFWKDLAAVKPTIYDSAVPMQEALVSGEIGVAMWAVPAVADPVIAQGAPLEYNRPNPGWGPQTMSYMPSWKPKSPNAAQVLFDWLASPEGQAIVGNKNVSVLPNIPNTLASFESTTVVNFATDLDQAKADKDMAAWRTAFGR